MKNNICYFFFFALVAAGIFLQAFSEDSLKDDQNLEQNLENRSFASMASDVYNLPIGTEPVLQSDGDYTLILPPNYCLLYTSPSPRDQRGSRMPSSA